jgi:dipeptidyl aminopeptidase/acylaminoacyl peptidase
VRWLDNDNIIFLGEMPGDTEQIYCLNVVSHYVKQISRHSTDILAFDATADLRSVVYLARHPTIPIIDEFSKSHGMLIDDKMPLFDLLVGHRDAGWWNSPLELFVKQHGRHARRLLFKYDETPIPMDGISLSPDGKFAVVASNTKRYATPESWRRYKTILGGNENEFLVHLLINIETGVVRPIINAPTNWKSSYAWSADSRSVIIGGTFLPLDTNDSSEQDRRETATWAVEVDLQSGAISKIAQGDYRVLRWDMKTNTVLLKPYTAASLTQDTIQPDTRVFAYRKSLSGWERQVDSIAVALISSSRIEVLEEQDMNTPPRLFISNHETGVTSILLDLNPQFRRIRFGHVEEIEWRATDGKRSYIGGLYLPPDYLKGRRYPLVIQAYGWTSNEFWIDGPTASGFAAQALVGKGIAVMEIPLAAELATPEEGPSSMAMIEGLIDELANRGIVDRTRIGLMGFSRAGYAVRYTIAFSKYPIATAVVVAGNEGGYLEYLAGFHPRAGGDYEGQNGGPPYGRSLDHWLRTAPGFNLDKITTPLRELSFAEDILLNWESFVGLKRLGKSVELIWLPDAAHELVKPSERLAVQQGNVDWFCFWLKGETNPQSFDRSEYSRWRRMRDTQKQGNSSVTATTR